MDAGGRGRRRTTGLGATAVLVAAGLAAGCGDAADPVGVGLDGADARTVVVSYVEALDRGDVAAAERLMTPKFADRVAGASDSWFTNTNSITDLRVLRVFRDRDDSSDGVRFFRAVYVPVEFTVDVRREGSIRDGRTAWGYILIERNRATPWLIDQDGVG